MLSLSSKSRVFMVNFGWLGSKFHSLFWFVFYMVIEVSDKFSDTELVLGFTNN